MNFTEGMQFGIVIHHDRGVGYICTEAENVTAAKRYCCSRWKLSCGSFD